MFKKIKEIATKKRVVKSTTMTGIMQILMITALLLMCFEQMFFAGVAFGLVIVFFIVTMTIVKQERKQFEQMAYKKYQSIKQLSLEELINDADKSAGLNNINLYYLKLIIAAKEGKNKNGN